MTLIISAADGRPARIVHARTREKPRFGRSSGARAQIPRDPIGHAWIELGLATPVCTYAAWPFHARAIASLRNMHLNMFTLIGLGVTVAYGYSMVAVFLAGEHALELRTELVESATRAQAPRGSWS